MSHGCWAWRSARTKLVLRVRRRAQLTCPIGTAIGLLTASIKACKFLPFRTSCSTAGASPQNELAPLSHTLNRSAPTKRHVLPLIDWEGSPISPSVSVGSTTRILRASLRTMAKTNGRSATSYPRGSSGWWSNCMRRNRTTTKSWRRCSVGVRGCWKMNQRQAGEEVVWRRLRFKLTIKYWSSSSTV